MLPEHRERRLNSQVGPQRVQSEGRHLSPEVILGGGLGVEADPRLVGEEAGLGKGCTLLA